MPGECKNCGNELSQVCMQCHACMGCTNPDVQHDRITQLDEALRVLATEVDAWRYLADGAEDSSWSTAWRDCGDDCSDAEEKTNANPIASEAVRRAGG